MLFCPIFTLTWYPGDYPSRTGAIVLQSGEHFADAYAGLSAGVEDLIQTAEFHRGGTPEFYNRGNRQALLQWEEVRKFADPSAALAEGLSVVAAMPQVSGWLEISIPDQGRAFIAVPCMIKAARFPQVSKSGTDHLLRLQWSLLCGAITEIATTTEDGALTSEIGVALLTEAGDYLALQALT